MRGLMAIIFCTLMFIYGTFTYEEERDDLSNVPMENLSSDDNVTNVNHNDTDTITITENPFAGSNNASDLVWLNEAIRDVAYYLRAHKFNEYDRRYHTTKPNESEGGGQYYARYPKPPLRSLHWEVQQNCEYSFVHCMEYLIKRVKNTFLRRKDDTAIAVNEQQWFGSNYTGQINTVEEECKKLRGKDDKFAKPFQGPLERFQWRTTVSYFMCWYAMNEVSDLQNLQEPCDNYANCLDSQYGANNHDPRANDNDSFRCILYSACPDPCCPLKHISNFNECWDNELNPCYQGNEIGNRNCTYKREMNRDFTDLVLNHWNVSCQCNQSGFEWSSKYCNCGIGSVYRYGTCVDMNECVTSQHNCSKENEICVNLPGSYRCACNWGYIWNEQLQKCTTSPALSVIKRHHQPVTNESQPSGKFQLKSLFKLIFSKSAAGRFRFDSILLTTVCGNILVHHISD